MNRPAKAKLQNPLKVPMGTQLLASSDGALLLFGLFVGVVGLLSWSLGVLPASAQVTYRDYSGDDGGRILRTENGRGGTSGRHGASGGLYGAQLVRPVLRYTEPAGGGFNTPTWSDCDNNPGLRKNLEQFGRFIPAAIMGNDDRCPLSYAPNAPEIERQFYGVVDIYYAAKDGKCVKSGGACESTGNLVVDNDIVIASAHGFRDEKTGRRLTLDEIRRGFKFTIKVWVPPSARYRQDEPYEYRSYRAQDVEFGSSDERGDTGNDVAFIRLDRPVGVRVGPTDDQGAEDLSRAEVVSREKVVKPLPFRRFDRSAVPNIVMTAGFQADKTDGDAYKNCRPFQLYEIPPSSSKAKGQNILAHDGDTNGVASGSALALMVDGRPHFAALHIGAHGATNIHEGEFDIDRRFNFAIDGQSFYDRFMQFRRRYGRN
ncbi:MAG: hypothetical protein IT288_16440 [Bdellovibrionales bacterium]|nr:hypothetical protein [Bdellovibrionales bacterium]